LHKN